MNECVLFDFNFSFSFVGQIVHKSLLYNKCKKHGTVNVVHCMSVFGLTFSRLNRSSVSKKYVVYVLRIQAKYFLIYSELENDYLCITEVTKETIGNKYLSISVNHIWFVYSLFANFVLTVPSKIGIIV